MNYFSITKEGALGFPMNKPSKAKRRLVNFGEIERAVEHARHLLASKYNHL